MTLQEQLQADLKEAIANKDNFTRDILKVAVSELTRGKFKEINDEQVLAILRKMKADAITCGNLNELPVFSKYVPEMLSEAETTTIVEEIITANNITSVKEMGKIMGQLSKHPQSKQIDKKFANTLITSMLS